MKNNKIDALLWDEVIHILKKDDFKSAETIDACYKTLLSNINTPLTLYHKINSETVQVRAALAKALYFYANLLTLFSETSIKHDDCLMTQLKTLQKQEFNPKKISDWLQSFKFDFVLTAHPTRVNTENFMWKKAKLSAYLKKNSLFKKSAAKSFMLASCWRALKAPRLPKTSKTEALFALKIATDVLWNAAPRFVRTLNQTLTKLSGLPENDLTLQPLCFSSWIGADKDGNPKITAKIIETVAKTNRQTAINIYIKSINAIKSKNNTVVEALKKIKKIIQKNEFNDARPVLTLLEQLLADQHIPKGVRNDLVDLYRQFQIFGIGIYKLDVRQSAEYHAALFKKINQAPLPPILADLKETFKVIAKIPAEQRGFYIASGACYPKDIMAILFLQQKYGITNMPIVPLFEQALGLKNAVICMASLFKNPYYRAHIQNQQMIMIGFSDSTKSLGYLPARILIYKTMEQLIKLAQKEKIQLTFFQGRGGSFERGHHQKILHKSQELPPFALQYQWRETVQGNQIETYFSTEERALFHFDAYFCAALAHASTSLNKTSYSLEASLEKIEKKCARYFSNAVKSNTFLNYFKAVTPFDYFKHLKISNRPDKRYQRFSVNSIRAIPWVFSWAQNQSHLAGLLGANQIIRELQNKNKRLHLLKHPFWRAVLSGLQHMIDSSDPPVFALYEKILLSPDLLRYAKRQGFSDKLSALKIAMRNKSSPPFTQKPKRILSLLLLSLLQETKNNPSLTVQKGLVDTMAGLAIFTNTG